MVSDPAAAEYDLFEILGAVRIILECRKHKSSTGKWLYLMLCREANSVKIGIADNAKSRLAYIQCGCPLDVELMAIVPGGGRALEKRLHRVFSKYHMRGEWYRYEGVVKHFADGLAKGSMASE